MNISVVIPLLNEQDSLKELYDWIAKVMQSNRFSYEIIFIDDGSTDDSWLTIMQLSQKDEHVKGKRLVIRGLLREFTQKGGFISLLQFDICPIWNYG